MRPSFDKVKIVRELVIMFGWKRVGIISDSYVVYKEQPNKLFQELRLINVTVLYYNINSVKNSRQSSNCKKNLKNIMNSIKENARVLIIYMYGLVLEEMSLLSKENSMEKGYVFIVASDRAFNMKTAKNYWNWVTITIALPNLNEDDVAVDLTDPLFGVEINSSSSQDEEEFSFAGKCLFSQSNKLLTC